MLEKKEMYNKRESEIVVNGTMVYSFGKNGPGLSNEFLEIGSLIKTLSKDNHVYLEDSFIDACDDVYSLKFKVVPHEDNEWFLRPDIEEESSYNHIDFPEELKYTTTTTDNE